MKAYSVELREKIVQAYEKNEGSQRQLASRFKVSLSFIERLLKRYREQQTVSPSPHAGGFRAKLATYEGEIAQIVEEDNDATLDELCQKVAEKYNVIVSTSTMCRVLQKLNLTRKKTLHATQAESLRVQTLRVKYWEQIRDVHPENLIFIDETGVNLTMVRSHARALGGNRAYGERPDHHRENITLIGAIGLSGWVGAMTLDGGTNGDTFRFFLENILVPNLWEGACVVMDNLPAHKVKGVRELIEHQGAKLVYLSPYSPDFNPIENCWSKVKECLRSVAARSRDALDEAITVALDSIVSNDIRNYFSHCCYCIPLS